MQHVFIDTNVLINDFFYRNRQRISSKPASLAIQFLKSKPKVDLYVASFSLVQFVSTLERAKIPTAVVVEELKRILSRFKLIDLTAKDFNDALLLERSDTEDALQYILCRKLRCFYLITDNIRDFQGLLFVTAIKPKQVRKIVF